jgi:hypothetical protein
MHKQLAEELHAQVTQKPDEVKLLVKAVELKEKGRGWKEIKAQIPLTHQKLDRAWYLNGLLEAGKVERTKFAGMTEAAQGVRVAALRAEGLSWGQVSLRIGVSEGRTQGIFERTTQVAAQGTRTQKGGRFFKGEKEFYKGNHKGFGVERKPGEVPSVKALKEDDTSILEARVKAARARVTRQPRTRKPKAATVEATA